MDSILAQTFTDFECILIDDGSTDDSPGICDGYAKQDGRITVIRQNRAGVSAARNEGLRKSTGKYIAFIDSDDWIDNRRLELMYERSGKDGVDIVYTDIRIVSGDYCRLAKFRKHPLKEIIEGDFATVWRFLFGRQVCQNVLFSNELKYGEDYLFVTQCALASSRFVKVVNGKDFYYNYYIHSNGVMQNQDYNAIAQQCLATQYVEDILRKSNSKYVKSIQKRKRWCRSQLFYKGIYLFDDKITFTRKLVGKLLAIINL
jgi:glycosyltransferase involved in cell wall biosynthesis